MTQLIEIVIVASGVIYLILMLLYLYGWRLTTVYQANTLPQDKATIIIAARNEATNIERIIQSALDQGYRRDLLQVIVVNDHSEDNTLQLAQSFTDDRLLVLDMPKGLEGKKDAISYAIQHATGSWILTTDADCRVPEKWVQTTVAYGNEYRLSMVLGLLRYNEGDGFLYALQQLELAALLGITAGSLWRLFPHMANGANLAYRRELFEQLGGYSNTPNSPSGDDVMLMNKAQEHGILHVAFLISKDTIVETKPATTWPQFARQRLRWASKSAGMGNSKVTAVMGFLYLHNLLLLLGIPAAILYPQTIPFVLLAWAFKVSADVRLMSGVLSFTFRSPVIYLFIPAQIVYTLFMVLAGPLSLILPVKWKGRSY